MLKQIKPAILATLLFTVLCGVAYPLAMTAASRLLFPHQSGGSLLQRGGAAVGSELIGQGFVTPGYFHPRPSAAGSGYDATSSGGTNLGPTSDKLMNGIHKGTPAKADPGDFDGIKDLAASYRKENNMAPSDAVPADAVTRSASGLDPHISPANAFLQAGRVAAARGLTIQQVRALVTLNTEGRQLGILGEPRVNVLNLNLALDAVARH